MPDVRSTKDLDAATIARAERALRKQQLGESINDTDRRAVAAVRKARQWEQRAEAYADVPKLLWLEWSGRQAKVLNEQARRYGLPIVPGSKTFDLAELAKWLHDFLADNRHALKSEDADDPRIKLDVARAEMMAMQVRERRSELMDREQIRGAMVALGEILRRGVDLLKRRGLTEAHEIMDESISEFVQALPRLLGDAPDDGNKSNGNSSKRRKARA